MRTPLLVLASFAALTANAARAADGQPAAKPTKTAAVKEEASDADGADQMKHLRLTFGLGYLTSYTPALDVGVMIPLSQRLYVGGSIMTSVQFKTAQDTGDGTNTKYSTTSAFSLLQAKSRYFLTDSLNLTGGLGTGSAQSEYSLKNDVGTNSRRYVVSSVVASAAIGNQWLLSDQLILGIDWVGYETPLYHKRTSSGSTEPAPSSEQNTDNPHDIAARNRADALGSRGQFILGLASLGWRF